jgi:predicted HTH domain antitoxin
MTMKFKCRKDSLIGNKNTIKRIMNIINIFKIKRNVSVEKMSKYIGICFNMKLRKKKKKIIKRRFNRKFMIANRLHKNVRPIMNHKSSNTY